MGRTSNLKNFQNFSSLRLFEIIDWHPPDHISKVYFTIQNLVPLLNEGVDITVDSADTNSKLQMASF